MTYSFPVINLQATGENIKFLMNKNGYTVRDLQNYFGFEAPQAIYKWLSGKSLPSIDNCLALSRLFEVHMEDLLHSEDHIEHSNIIIKTNSGMQTEACIPGAFSAAEKAA